MDWIDLYTEERRLRLLPRRSTPEIKFSQQRLKPPQPLNAEIIKGNSMLSLRAEPPCAFTGVFIFVLQPSISQSTPLLLATLTHFSEQLRKTPRSRSRRGRCLDVSSGDRSSNGGLRDVRDNGKGTRVWDSGECCLSMVECYGKGGLESR